MALSVLLLHTSAIRSATTFVFAANNFNDAYRRWQYLRRYNDYRKRQVQLIIETQKSLKEQKAELEAANRQNLPIIWRLLNAVADDANVLGMEKEALIEDFMIAYGEALGNIGFNNRDIMRMSAQGLAA